MSGDDVGDRLHAAATLVDVDASPERYPAVCHGCHATFDAMAAPWCSCLVTERTVVCPKCGECFCKAPASYKRTFWSGAPRLLWDRKFAEHQTDFVPRPNPEPGEVVRPLVLLVDDEADVLRVATHTIESLGYGTVIARDGAAGLEMARRYRPQLVLTDALMPKLDGREMCRLIKADPETAGSKVVVMTALYTAMKYKTEGQRNFKADDYVTKPLEVAALRALLHKHLG